MLILFLILIMIFVACNLFIRMVDSKNNTKLIESSNTKKYLNDEN